MVDLASGWGAVEIGITDSDNRLALLLGEPVFDRGDVRRNGAVLDLTVEDEIFERPNVRQQRRDMVVRQDARLEDQESLRRLVVGEAATHRSEPPQQPAVLDKAEEQAMRRRLVRADERVALGVAAKAATVLRQHLETALEQPGPDPERAARQSRP